MKRAVVLGAHGDDEVLGCGATVKRLVREGWRVDHILVTEERNGWRKALDLIGYRSGRCLEMAHMRLDTVPEAELADALLAAMRELERETSCPPDLVFTHSLHDLNVDHRAVHLATLVACRPSNMRTAVLAYSIAGSSAWGAPSVGAFIPTRFIAVDVADVQAKCRAFAEAYAAEVRDNLHPRSIAGIELDARRWGQHAGFSFCEPFELVWDYRTEL